MWRDSSETCVQLNLGDSGARVAIWPSTLVARSGTMITFRHPTQNQLALGGEAQDIINCN